MQRLISLLLVLAMLCALFIGCSRTEAPAEEQTAAAQKPSTESTSDESPTESESSTESEAAAEPEPLPEQAEDVSEESAPEPEQTAESERGVVALPLAEGETLKYWLPWLQMLDSYYSEYNEHPAIAKAEERTGVHIEFISTSQQAATMEFSLMLAAGDYPDIISNISYYTNGLDHAVQEEIFVDLAPHLADWAPDYNYYLQSNEIWKKYAITDEGNIVGFYGFDKLNLGDSSGPMIRQDWLDSLGLDTPETIDDWYETLTAFKQAYDISDPYMMSATCTSLASAFNTTAFDLSGTNGACFYLKDGKVTCAFVEPEYRDYIEAMHKWHSEGLFAKEFYARTGSTAQDEMTSAILNGQCGIFETVMKNVEDYEKQSAIDGFALSAITWPKHSDGSGLNNQKIDPGMGSTSAISTNCANLELAMNWANYWFTDEGQLLANYGVEGLSYTLDADGKPVYTDVIDSNPDGLIFQIARLMYCFNQIPSLGDPTIVRDHVYSQRVIDASGIWNSSYADSSMVLSGSVALSVEEAEIYSGIYPDIATYATETILRFILGETPMEEWDSFVEQVQAEGIDECTAQYQSAYDRYAGR